MRAKPFLFLLFVIFGAFLVEARAASYGYSYMEIYQDDPAASMRVYAETGTVIDLSVWYWYDPGIQGYMYEDSYLIDSTERIMNYEGPEIYLWIDLEAKYGRTYKIHGDHWVRALNYYNSGGQPLYIDRFGFNYFQGNFPSPYNFSLGQTGYYYYNFYKAAATEVSLSASRPLHLASVDKAGGVPGETFITMLRGTGFFGTGNGQGATQTVQLGKGITATVRPTSPNTIEVVEVEISISSNANVGDRNMTLTVNGQTSNSIPFRVGDRSPQITSITPPQGDAGDQVSVSIHGTNFGVNPDVEIAGLGVARTITASTSTQIDAIFSVASTADPGTRGVKVRSRGISGTGFLPAPGISDTSNSVGFDVNAANPRVEIGDIGSVEKGRVKTITVRTINAPTGHVTKLRFKNQPPRPATRPTDGWKTGGAKFVDQNGADVDQIEYTGDQQQSIRIRGVERSSSKDNIELEARFNNDSDVKKDKSFTVSSVEFAVDEDCDGVDVVEFERTLAYDKRFLFVKRNGSNTVKAKVVPSGAIGSFKLEPANPDITLSPATVNSTNSVVLTVNANATAGQSTGIVVKPDYTDPLTRDAEVLNVISSESKAVVVELYAVTEDNDDVQETPTGQGAPNSVAYAFSEGANNFIDTIAGGDDWLAPIPIGQRPPGYSPRSRRVFTGDNGILETTPQGDDQMYFSEDEALMRLYAPVTEIGNGLAEVLCVSSGVNQFLDTEVHRNDREAVDPNNPALRVIMSGANGRCDSRAKNQDILAPSTLRDAQDAAEFAEDLETYLNSEIWAKQANVTITVNPNVHSIEKNFDLNRDGKLENLVLGNTATYVEADAIKDGQSPTAGTYNLYFVNLPVSKETVLGYVRNIPEQHSYYGTQFWSNDKKNEVIAHELGHLFGSIHTADDTHSAEFKEFYKPDVMYYSRIPAMSQCRIRKPQWDKTLVLP